MLASANAVQASFRAELRDNAVLQDRLARAARRDHHRHEDAVKGSGGIRKQCVRFKSDRSRRRQRVDCRTPLKGFSV